MGNDPKHSDKSDTITVTWEDPTPKAGDRVTIIHNGATIHTTIKAVEVGHSEDGECWYTITLW